MTVSQLIKILLKVENEDAEVLIMCPAEDEVEWYPSHISTVESTDDETVMITVK